MAKKVKNPSNPSLVIPDSFPDRPTDGFDSIGYWCKFIHQIPQITPDEEEALYKRAYQDNDPLAQNELVMRNLGLVVAIVRKFVNKRRGGLSLSDLIQEGNIGLIQAVKKFDYRKGYKFSTYATYWIHQAIARAITTQSNIIRYPSELVEKSDKACVLSSNFEIKHGRKPTLEELAQLLEVNPKTAARVLAVQNQPFSLDTTPAGHDPDKRPLIESVADPESNTSKNVLLRYELKALLNLLDDRSKKILTLSFGLDGHDRHTLDEIGQQFNLSRKRVGQIIKRALTTLKNNDHAQSLYTAITI